MTPRQVLSAAVVVAGLLAAAKAVELVRGVPGTALPPVAAASDGRLAALQAAHSAVETRLGQLETTVTDLRRDLIREREERSILAEWVAGQLLTMGFEESGEASASVATPRSASPEGTGAFAAAGGPSPWSQEGASATSVPPAVMQQVQQAMRELRERRMAQHGPMGGRLRRTEDFQVAYGLDEAQTTAVAQIMADYDERRRQVFEAGAQAGVQDGGQEPDFRSVRESIRALQEDRDRRIAETLNDEQRSRFEADQQARQSMRPFGMGRGGPGRRGR